VTCKNKGMTLAADAFKAIMASESVFISRADVREHMQKNWIYGRERCWNPGRWYIQTGLEWVQHYKVARKNWVIPLQIMQPGMRLKNPTRA